MPESKWTHPSLWRIVVFALIFGLVGNTLLWNISGEDDWFATAIAIASGVGAAALTVCWFRYPRWVDDVLLFVFAIWIANAIEFAMEQGPTWEHKTRQGALYVSEALLALGAYVARRTSRNGQ